MIKRFILITLALNAGETAKKDAVDILKQRLRHTLKGAQDGNIYGIINFESYYLPQMISELFESRIKKDMTMYQSYMLKHEFLAFSKIAKNYKDYNISEDPDLATSLRITAYNILGVSSLNSKIVYNESVKERMPSDYWKLLKKFSETDISQSSLELIEKTGLEITEKCKQLT